MQNDFSAPFQFKSENFFLYEDVRTLDPSQAASEWAIIVVCVKGSMQIQVDGKTYTFQRNDMAFAHSDRILESLMISPDFEGRLLGCSRQFAKQILPNSATIWHKALFLYQNLVVHLDDDIARDLERSYRFFKETVVRNDLLYYDDIMRCLTQALIFHLASVLDHVIDSPTAERGIQSKELLCREFLNLLSTTRPRPRTVEWYSKRLYKTPKYLSTAVKKVSGKTASIWIQEMVVAEIAELLRNSPKSIKEICDDLDFPSLSSFGRYVRTHLGKSPREYRKFRGGDF